MRRAAVQRAEGYLSENGLKILDLKGQAHVVDVSEEGLAGNCDGSWGGRGRKRRRKDKWTKLR